MFIWKGRNIKWQYYYYYHHHRYQSSSSSTRSVWRWNVTSEFNCKIHMRVSLPAPNIVDWVLLGTFFRRKWLRCYISFVYLYILSITPCWKVRCGLLFTLCHPDPTMRSRVESGWLRVHSMPDRTFTQGCNEYITCSFMLRKRNKYISWNYFF